MVAPLVEKSKSETRRAPNGDMVYSYYRAGYTQKPPYVNTALYLIVLRGDNTSIHSMPFPLEGSVSDMAANAARKRFVDKLGSSSSFGASLTAELRQTWGTVVDGVSRTLLAARAVSRGDLPRAAKILGFAPPTKTTRHVMSKKKVKGGKFFKTITHRTYWVMPSGKYVLKSLANKWLWFSYAIKPLVSDIHNGMDVLTRPAPYSSKIKANGTRESEYDRRDYDGYRQYYKSHVRVSISATVSVRNPNLWLANQLGLVNPVQMFNEGIPFSFVIDWFSNLSQVISQLTDFVGLDIAQPVTSLKSKSMSRHEWNGYPPSKPISVTKEEYRRSLDIPSAKLKFDYEPFSWQRGLNAVSLLVGFLREVRR